MIDKDAQGKADRFMEKLKNKGITMDKEYPDDDIDDLDFDKKDYDIRELVVDKSC